MRQSKASLYEFRGNIVGILEDSPGKLIFSLEDERYQDILTFILTTSGINQHKRLITIGRGVKISSKAIGGGVITNPMHVNGIIEIS